MNNKEIINLKAFVDNNNTDKKVKRLTSVFFLTHRDELKRLMNKISAENLSKDGSESMGGDLNIGGNKIVNIQPFVEDDDKDQSGQVRDASKVLLYT